MQTFLLGVLLVRAVPSGNVSYTAPIDADHKLLLIGGRIVNYPAMGEYGMNIVSLGPGESLRLTISENSGSTWELGDPSIGLGALFSARVARVDRDSVVIERNVTEGYGAQTFLQYTYETVHNVFDSGARRLVHIRYLWKAIRSGQV